MKEFLQEQKIYFICGGTSVNNIIQSINKSVNSTTNNHKKENFFSSLKEIFVISSSQEEDKKINEEEYPKLDELGIHEMCMCYNNKDVQDMIKNIATKDYNIYTSLNYSCIESAFILFNGNDYIKLLPLPYISNTTKIETERKFTDFKSMFGKYEFSNRNSNSIKNETSIIGYWNKKNSNHIVPKNIREINGIIDWKYTYKNHKLSSYNYINFINSFMNESLSNFEEVDDIIDDNFENNIFICESELIIDILKKIKDKAYKYNNKIDIVEHSSVWEFKVDFSFEYNTHNRITKKDIIYKSFTKIYPTKDNYAPLLNEHYKYKYNNHTYKLFNSLENINIEYIKNLNFSRYSMDRKTSIKKFFNKNFKNNKKSNNIKNNKNNNRKKINFDELPTNI